MKEISIIDIGAAGGLIEPWSFVSDRLKAILAFDPSEKARSAGNLHFFQSAIWSFSGRKRFYNVKRGGWIQCSPT